MREAQLRSIDLNLLVILKAVLDERHISRAADKLNMSQSAVSRAVSKLRSHFDDPLLIRKEGEYFLSARAQTLYKPVSELIAQAQVIFAPLTDIPENITGTLNFASFDDGLLLYMPRIIKYFSHNYSGVNLNFKLHSGSIEDSLFRGDTDFLIEIIPEEKHMLNVGQSFHSIKLASIEWVCLLSKKHTLAGESLNLEDYCRLKHGVVSLSGSGPGLVDDVLQGIGRKRDLSLRVPQFSLIPKALEFTDFVFTVPRIVAEKLLQDGSLISLPLPFSMPILEYALIWHHRYDDDQFHTWARERIQIALEDRN